MFIIIYIAWPKICLPNIYSQFGKAETLTECVVIYACFYSLFYANKCCKVGKGRKRKIPRIFRLIIHWYGVKPLEYFHYEPPIIVLKTDMNM